MRFFKLFFASLLGTVAGMVATFFLVVGGVAWLATFSGKGPSDKADNYEDGVILHLEFQGGVVDYIRQDPMRFLELITDQGAPQPVSLVQVVEMIRRAGEAKQIKSILLDLRGSSLSWTAADTIRKELLGIKGKKKITAYSESYNELDLFVASAADHVVMVPHGYVEFNGLSFDQIYMKRALDGLEIKPILVRAGAYKAAAEPLIRETMSEEEKEQLQAYLSSVWKYVSEAIISRKPEELKTLNQLADSMSIVTDKDAYDYRLIDDLKYYDEVVSKPENLISMSEFYRKIKSSKSLKSLDPRVGVLYLEGEIGSGWAAREGIGSETVAHILEKLEESEDEIKALVIRVNSPGGDVVASEVINRAFVKVAEKMPVIISFGDMAASGGYYISSIGRPIFADPLGLTGSIGVFTLGFNIEGLMKNKLRVSSESVKTHALSDFMSSTRNPSEAEIKILEKGVQEAYARFLEITAEGRGKKVEEIEPLAQGRIWSGLQAKENGLVDQMGHLIDALDQAAKEANVKGPYQIVTLNDMIYWSSIWEELNSMNSSTSIQNIFKKWGLGSLWNSLTQVSEGPRRPLLLEARNLKIH
ncbi:MAG: signal peptide peptidase SppA [Pseudobdellovibrionaceae bacterium]